MSENKHDEALVNRVAGAMMKAAIRHAKERIEQHAFPTKQIETAFEIAQGEADRSASILLFALAEDLMLGCLKMHMNPEVHGGWKGVTGANGLLATAADRITVLELLYWIRPSTGADLRLMKQIRNRFAHHATVHSFGDKMVAGWISSMSQHEQPVLPDPDLYKEKKPTLRSLYLMRGAGTLHRLATDLAIGPVARQEQLNPQELLKGDFDKQPQNIKDATRSQARLMVNVALQDGS